MLSRARGTGCISVVWIAVEMTSLRSKDVIDFTFWPQNDEMRRSRKEERKKEGRAATGTKYVRRKADTTKTRSSEANNAEYDLV